MSNMRSETLQMKLNNFHKAFNHPTNAAYEKNYIDILKSLRIKLIQEEYIEVMDALYHHKNEEDILKELCDLVYVCVGFADTFGWNFDVAFNRVHNSNMSKLNIDGKPIYREDGKIMKSSLYKEPKLNGLTGGD